MNQYQSALNNLLTGELSANDLVGEGFERSLSTASACLRLKLHNTRYPMDQLSEVFVAENGKAFSTIKDARLSSEYKLLEKGLYRASGGQYDVERYGIMRAIDGGYMGYIVLCKQKTRSQKLWEIAKFVSVSDFDKVSQKLNMYYPNPTSAEQKFFAKIKGVEFTYAGGEWYMTKHD